MPCLILKLPATCRYICVLPVQPPTVLQPLQVSPLVSLASVHRNHQRRQRHQDDGDSDCLQGTSGANRSAWWGVLNKADQAGFWYKCMDQLQVLCGKCGNGLGHEFVNDGPQEGVSRFWIFSHSLKFVPNTGKMMNVWLGVLVKIAALHCDGSLNLRTLWSFSP